MPAWWEEREVVARPEQVELPGRVLWLVDDAAAVRAQLAGADLGGSTLPPLRDDVSTDEITPARVCYHFDDTLGEYAYLGLAAGGDRPVGAGQVRAGGFVASVTGRRRGKGSSREAAPLAERAAGLRVVLALSFERIYEANCINLGLLPSRDLTLADAIASDRRLPLAAFLAGRDPITAEIIRFGGLFEYNVARLQGRVAAPTTRRDRRPATLAERILARHWRHTGGVGASSLAPGDAGFVVVDLRFSHEYVTPMAAAFWDGRIGPGVALTDPGSVILFRDHLALLGDALDDEPNGAATLQLVGAMVSRQAAFAAQHGLVLHDASGPGGGICHTVVLERYALPGQVILGTDSHTCQAGAVGALAFGCGTTDMFNAWFTGDARLTVPPTVRVELAGSLPADVAAKDAMLLLLAHPRLRAGSALGAVLEFGGEAVERMSIDERATLTNMAAEAGAFTGLVAPDQKVVEHLVGRGVPRADAERRVAAWHDTGPGGWSEVVRLDLAELEPQVSAPYDPGNGRPVRELEGLPVDIAYLGSCTGGKRDDIETVATVFAWGAERGLRVHPRVRCYIQCGSDAILGWAQASGHRLLFERVGATLLPPGCGACINAGPGVSRHADEVTISSINRNFPGRSGPGKVYLASPATVAASALAGSVCSWPRLRHLAETPSSSNPDRRGDPGHRR